MSESRWICDQSDPCLLQTEGALKLAVLMVRDPRCGEGVLDDTMNKVPSYPRELSGMTQLRLVLQRKVKQLKL